ncbi:MAG: isopentenyl-diphosphate Delta-isomerase [Bacillota bacterium]|jgi:isopentenyl-diphosphate delta-isomerase
MINQIILVDSDDCEIGRTTKYEAHYKPLLHRAFSLFIYDGNHLLLQKRAADKYHSGGLWANTCCSHPQPDMKIEKCIMKRLFEETGIICDYVEEIFAFEYEHKFADDLYEHEYDHVFIGEIPSELGYTVFDFDPDEIAEMKWMSFDDVLADIEKHPEKYAPWFLIAVPKVIDYLRKKKY